MAMTYNSTVKLTCKPGFAFDHGNRNQLVRCSKNKKWTGLEDGRTLNKLRLLLLVVFSACGGIRTDISMPVLTTYFPMLA